jgi:protease I
MGTATPVRYANVGFSCRCGNATLGTARALPTGKRGRPQGVSVRVYRVRAPIGRCWQVTNRMKGVRVAFMGANEGMEQVELLVPWKAVVDAGGRPELIAPRPGLAGTMRHLDRGDRFPVDVSTAQARPEDFDAVVLPGGVVHPDLLRRDRRAVQFLVAMVEAGKPVAAICHGPSTLIEGRLLAGRTVTSTPSLQTDLRNAGAKWTDEGVVICRAGAGPMITSRGRNDLPAFCLALTEVFAESTMAVAGS